jgi:hypothetical protein
VYAAHRHAIASEVPERQQECGLQYVDGRRQQEALAVCNLHGLRIVLRPVEVVGQCSGIVAIAHVLLAVEEDSERGQGPTLLARLCMPTKTNVRRSKGKLSVACGVCDIRRTKELKVNVAAPVALMKSFTALATVVMLGLTTTPAVLFIDAERSARVYGVKISQF